MTVTGAGNSKNELDTDARHPRAGSGRGDAQSSTTPRGGGGPRGRTPQSHPARTDARREVPRHPRSAPGQCPCDGTPGTSSTPTRVTRGGSGVRRIRPSSGAASPPRVGESARRWRPGGVGGGPGPERIDLQTTRAELTSRASGVRADRRRASRRERARRLTVQIAGKPRIAPPADPAVWRGIDR
jgi:hypothetical protein